jgi:hypothetical protein
MTYRSLADYIKLIRAFLSNEIDALTFQRQYLDMFKADKTMWEDSKYELLNNIFSSVEAFCADENIQGMYTIRESQLREETAHAFKHLEKLS